MQNNAPCCVFKFTYEFFKHKRFTEEKITEWQQTSPDLNPIKNLWSIIKMKLYDGSKQHNHKEGLWKAIKTGISETEHAEVKKNKKING